MPGTVTDVRHTAVNMLSWSLQNDNQIKKKKIRAREIDYNIVSLGGVWGAERVAVGSVKGVQSRFGEPERTLRGNEASL